MNTLFLSPHADDSTLFGAYTLLRHKPTLVICLYSKIQGLRGGPMHGTRAAEEEEASKVLGVEDLRMLSVPDGLEFVPYESGARGEMLEHLRFEFRHLDEDVCPDRVFAPVVYDTLGHFDHDMIGTLARDIFGDRVTYYHTYRRGSARERSETQVSQEPHWPAIKFQAMACYASQINLDNTRPWFSDWDKEWYA
jgi:LmbE family N-acetylglucosaminyl deacetylase